MKLQKRKKKQFKVSTSIIILLFLWQLYATNHIHTLSISYYHKLASNKLPYQIQKENSDSTIFLF